ncbi:SIMPL domain-containing protein [Sanguibacter sp. 25GB23B1]|uniref:SIMPL domain-containing protein n=1 Tax=unclassified Sanguibacter TaxID=2645534 RepID=UPI0032AF9D7B
MSLPGSATIAVTGHDSLHHHPERGSLQLAVSFESSDRERAVALVRTLHDEVVREAQGFVDSGAATRWSSEQIAVWSAEKWTSDDTSTQEKHQLVRYHVAAVSVTVRFQDFAALGEWAVRRGSVDGCSISGVDWDLTDDTRSALLLTTRTGAVRDARSRAEAYAAAAGFSGVELVAMYEEGLRPHASPGAGVMMAASRGSAGVGDGPSVELRPADITVGATVTADYRTV